MLTFSSLQLDTLENKLNDLAEKKNKKKMKLTLKLIKKTKNNAELYKSEEFRTLGDEPEPIVEQTYETALHKCDAVMQKDMVLPTV